MKVFDYNATPVERNIEAITQALDDHDSFVEDERGIYKIILIAGFDDDGNVLGVEFQLYKAGQFLYKFTDEEGAINYFLRLTE